MVYLLIANMKIPTEFLLTDSMLENKIILLAKVALTYIKHVLSSSSHFPSQGFGISHAPGRSERT